MKFEDMKGRTITKIEVSNEDEIEFTFDDGLVCRMCHYQDCCESVYIESIVGELTDLLNTPLTLAEEVVNCEDDKGWESVTWTFYKLATVKGYVDIRWCGTSNGYYSESVDFEVVKKPQ